MAYAGFSQSVIFLPLLFVVLRLIWEWSFHYFKRKEESEMLHTGHFVCCVHFFRILTFFTYKLCWILCNGDCVTCKRKCYCKEAEKSWYRISLRASRVRFIYFWTLGHDLNSWSLKRISIFVLSTWEEIFVFPCFLVCIFTLRFWTKTLPYRRCSEGYFSNQRFEHYLFTTYSLLVDSWMNVQRIGNRNAIFSTVRWFWFNSLP